MKQSFIFWGALILASVALLPTGSALAQNQITFTSAVANWHSPTDDTPGSQPGDPVITNGVPTSSISWGTTTGPQSGYDVTVTLPDPTMFPVVVFAHRNFPVSDPSLTSVQLDIILDFEVDGAQTGPLTFTFTFTHDETPNNQDPCPYPTPPGEGCTDRVTFVDIPDPTTFTVGGVTYTLGLTFLDENGDPVDEFITLEGGLVNTANLDGQFVVVPPVLEVTKSGPATMAAGQSGVFTIDVGNSGPNDAWDTTIRDALPDGPTGGMCDYTPQVLSAQVFAADGVTPVPGKGPLLDGSDYTFSYSGAPACELNLAMLTPAAAIDTDQRLIITYRTQLDADTQDGAVLTNVAGAVEWFDDLPSNPDRTTYTRTLTDGTPGVLDHEDAHTVQVFMPALLFEKTAVNVTSGESNARRPLHREHRPTAAAEGRGRRCLSARRIRARVSRQQGSAAIHAAAGARHSPPGEAHMDSRQRFYRAREVEGAVNLTPLNANGRAISQRKAQPTALTPMPQPTRPTIDRQALRPLAALALAIIRSVPPAAMPGYGRCWATWWRIALATMRRW